MKAHPSLIGLFATLTFIALSTGTPGLAQGDSGLLAVAGDDGNIHLYDVAAGTMTDVTTDAIAARKVYSWPTWSNDGQLAYFGVSLLPDDLYRLGIFIKPVGGEATQVYASPDEVFTYAFWSPGECPAGNCRDLAVLYTTADQELAVRRVRSTGTGFTIEEIAQGAPFYWDWSPDGDTMFWARAQHFELYDVASGEITLLDDQPGLHRSVDWSPVDDRVLAAITPDRVTSSLVIFDGDQRVVLAKGIEGIVAFEWSPDGTQVAYADDDAGRLFLIDAQTATTLATIADRVVGFFWSPDGRKIAYVTLTVPGEEEVQTRQQGGPVAQWHVYDVVTGTSAAFARFDPSREMLYYLSFYDQFARSHRLWSPDSRYLVYGERLRSGEEVVSLIDTTDPTRPPETLMNGSLGVFSW